MPTLEALRESLARVPTLRLAVVFGSFARGEAKGHSDLDLAVLPAADDSDDLWDVQVAVSNAVPRSVDLVDLRRAPPLLRFEIARDGVVLVEDREGEWLRFREQAMLDWWDWAPYARRFHQLAAQRLREELAHGPA